MIDDTALRATLRAGLKPAYARLRAVIGEYGSMVVAYSGGVDSGLLAYAARSVLGDRVLAVIGISPSIGAREQSAALGFLDRHGIPCERLHTNEMADGRYRRNEPDRCYFCKAELFTRLGELARARGYDHVAYGANLDDRGDHRPGAIAASERRVVAPLAEAGLDKRMVREMARALGLSLWDKPAAPCLASRIPYFQEVTRAKLQQIETAEDVLKDLGFEVCRVRHHGAVARIEIPKDRHPQVLREDVWNAVVAGIRRAGFRSATLEADGFRSGRLNDVLEASAQRGPRRGRRGAQ